MQGEASARSAAWSRSWDRLRARSAPRWSGPLGLAAAFALLAASSWGRWPDALAGFGRELYVAWRLASGDALYRDLAHAGGPLSPYANAGWFLLFGVSVRALVLANLAILAATCALLWRIFAAACGRGVAFACGLTLLAGFGFANPLVPGSGFATPAAHAATHGMALGFALAVSVGEALRRRRAAWWGGAGLCLGLAFLTRAELFAPAAAAALLGLAFEASAPDPRPVRAAALLGLASLLPVALAIAALATRMAEVLALVGVLGGIGEWSGFSAAPSGLGRLVGARHRGAWAGVPPALLLASALGLAALVVAALRRPRERVSLARRGPLALLAALALGLAADVALAAPAEPKDFGLAMPAVVLLVAGLVAGVGRLLGPRRRVARALGVGAATAALAAVVGASARESARARVAIGRGPDRIAAHGPGAAGVATALDRLGALLPPRATLLVFPEGEGVNYLLQRRNPSRFSGFTRAGIAAFGEGSMLADLRRDPPDFALLVPGEAGAGPGAGSIGGVRLREWLDADYERVDASAGGIPVGEGSGLVILRLRRPPSTAAGSAHAPGASRR